MKKPKRQVSMSKQSCRTRRVSAMLVSLLLLLSVFLSACGTGEEFSGQSGGTQADAKNPSGRSDLSSGGGISVEPLSSGTGVIGSETPILPAESETTVELVKEYPLGMEGIFVYLLFVDDPTYSQIIAPYDYYLDEDGNLYWFQDYMIRDVEAQKTISLSDGDENISYGYAYNGKIYTATCDGKLNAYAMSENAYEKISSVALPVSETQNYVLFPTDAGVPLVEIDDVVYNATSQTVVTPFSIAAEGADGDAAGTLSMLGKQYSYGEHFRILGYMDGILTTSEWSGRWFASGSVYYEYKICQYDEDGNLLSQFLIGDMFVTEMLPCSVTQGGNECKWYCGSTVTIGNEVFEGVMAINYFMGADNALYMMLVYPEGGKLYRINPGYSNVEFSDMSVLRDPADTSGDASEIASTTAETASSVTHVALSSGHVSTRAYGMMHSFWILQEEHAEIRDGYDVELPYCVANGTVGSRIYGIPYCHGGFNGCETIDSTNYKKVSFLEVVTQTASDGLLYTAGNIHHNGFVSKTIGLDCSGYVGSAYGLTYKHNVTMLNGYGHLLNSDENFSLDTLQPMDMILSFSSSGNHCYLFVSNNADGTVTVADCTGATTTAAEIAAGETPLQNCPTTRRVKASSLKGCTYRRVCYTYTYTDTQHTYSCDDCDVAVTENHSLKYSKYTSTKHRRYCTECDYSVYEEHSWGPAGDGIVCYSCLAEYTGTTSAIEEPKQPTVDVAYLDIERESAWNCCNEK